MVVTKEPKIVAHPGFAEQSFEEWIETAETPLPEGFRESQIATHNWQRGVKIGLAVYRYRIHRNVGELSSALAAKKGK